MSQQQHQFGPCLDAELRRWVLEVAMDICR